MKFLTEYGKLRLLDFKFPARPEKCYVWGKQPLLQVLTHLKSGVHFSHYTAMRMHGLTEQVPSSIYLTSERVSAVQPAAPLDVAKMAVAFTQPPRVSSNWVDFAGHRVYLLNGAYTDHLGVVTQSVSDGHAEQIDAPLTGLERTLIDIAVRPFYSGGGFEVAKAYYCGHLGKYVPGKAGVIFIRAAMLKSHGVPLGPGALSAGYETLASMAAGAAVGFALLPYAVDPEVLARQHFEHRLIGCVIADVDNRLCAEEVTKSV